jgi:hypothetical protein
MAAPRGRASLVPNSTRRRSAMNAWVIIAFVMVIAGAVFIGYGLIRPFTHTHHDHRDVIHPPHLD